MSLLRRWLGGGEPSAPEPQGDPVRIDEVRRVLASVEAIVRADGGRVELLGVEGGRVLVRLAGACAQCHASDLTLRGVLEPRLRAALPWFEELRAL